MRARLEQKTIVAESDAPAARGGIEAMGSRMASTGLPSRKLLDGLEIAKDERGLVAAANAFAQAMGLRWFAYLALNEGPPLLLTTLPQRAADQYLSLSYHAVDPVVAWARRSSRPFHWRCSEEARRPIEGGAALFRLADEIGITSGLTVPLQGGFGQFALFSLITDRVDIPFEHWSREAGDVLLEAALRFHVHAQARSAPLGDRGPSLSPREMQCLAWLAHGKTMAETGSILGISKRTVVHHLEEAKAKLDAVNVTQAVAKAIRSNLIS